MITTPLYRSWKHLPYSHPQVKRAWAGSLSTIYCRNIQLDPKLEVKFYFFSIGYWCGCHNTCMYVYIQYMMKVVTDPILWLGLCGASSFDSMASKAGSNMPMYFQPQMCLMKFCAIYYTLLPYTWGTSNSKLPGPTHCDWPIRNTELQFGAKKPIFLATSAHFDFIAINYTVWSHILSNLGDALNIQNWTNYLVSNVWAALIFFLGKNCWFWFLYIALW